MLKIGKLGISALFLSLLTACDQIMGSSLTSGNWQHRSEQDAMSDEAIHHLEVTGVTRRGNDFRFVFMCIGNRQAMYHENGSRGLVSEFPRRSAWGVPIKYRVGDASPSGLTLRLSEGGDKDAWIDRRFAPRNLKADSLLTGYRNLAETQNTSAIRKIMKGLADGQNLTIEYDEDISVIEPNAYFRSKYDVAKEECGL